MYYLLSKSKQDYKAIRDMSIITADEFVKCVDVIVTEAVSELAREKYIVTFWK